MSTFSISSSVLEISEIKTYLYVCNHQVGSKSTYWCTKIAKIFKKKIKHGKKEAHFFLIPKLKKRPK